MKRKGCRPVVVLPFLLSAAVANSQTLPTGPLDSRVEALNAQSRQVLDQKAQTVLAGRPSIAITGMVVVDGAETSLTNESVRDSVELVLRRNGIPIVSSCDGGSANCGRLGVMVRADCAKGLVLPDPSTLCAVYLKIGYRVVFLSGRTDNVPAKVFGEVIDSDGVKLTAGPFEDRALKQLTAWVESFSLTYLRANPGK